MMLVLVILVVVLLLGGGGYFYQNNAGRGQRDVDPSISGSPQVIYNNPTSQLPIGPILVILLVLLLLGGGVWEWTQFR